MHRVAIKDSTSTLKKHVKSLINPIRFRIRLARKTPVFIYQMGKVGSTSIHESLLKQYKGVVLHSHSFHPRHGNPDVRALYRRTIDAGNPLKVITLTREPISRNVSAFFQTFERTTGIPYAKSAFSIQELKQLFLLHGEHDVPLHWLDENILHNFGIDVYKKNISENGIAHYSRANVQVLLMRCETSDTHKENAIRKFLEMPNFHLQRRNVSTAKDYADTYTQFLDQVKLPEEYINRLCGSKYFRHFYDNETLKAVMSKWSDN